MLGCDLWQESCGHPGDLAVEWREPALPEVMSCKVALAWVVRNHELQACICSDFSHSENSTHTAAFSTAHDLHPGKSYSTTMISLHMEAITFSTAVPEIPHRGIHVASPRNKTIINLSPKKAQAWLWNQELGRKWVNCIYCSFLTSLGPWFCLCLGWKWIVVSWQSPGST